MLVCYQMANLLRYLGVLTIGPVCDNCVRLLVTIMSTALFMYLLSFLLKMLPLCLVSDKEITIIDISDSPSINPFKERLEKLTSAMFSFQKAM